MTTQTPQSGLTELTLPTERQGAYSVAPAEPAGNSWHPGRFSRFVPAPRGRVNPVVGLATDRPVALALAQGMGGWVNRDGRVLTKGSTVGNTALAALPETAAIVAAYEKAEEDIRACRDAAFDESRAEHIAKGRSEETFYFSHGTFDLANELEPFTRFLDRGGWLKVDLCRDQGVKVMGTESDVVEVDAYRRPLVALADILECRVFDGRVYHWPQLLYDPSEPDGTVKGIRTVDDEDDAVEDDRLKARWLSTDEIDDELDYDGDEDFPAPPGP